MRMRRLLVFMPVLAGAALVAAVPAVSATTSYCGITWGSLDKSALNMTGAPIASARTGRHDCFDRLVVDLAGMPAPGFHVRYTDGFRSEGAGTPLSISGGAVLTITVRAPAYDESGRLTVPSWAPAGTHIVSPGEFSGGGYRTFRDLVFGGTYEGQTGLGLGVRARLPFRVFTLDGPGSGSRLVVDVAHQW